MKPITLISFVIVSLAALSWAPQEAEANMAALMKIEELKPVIGACKSQLGKFMKMKNDDKVKKIMAENEGKKPDASAIPGLVMKFLPEALGLCEKYNVDKKCTDEAQGLLGQMDKLIPKLLALAPK